MRVLVANAMSQAATRRRVSVAQVRRYGQRARLRQCRFCRRIRRDRSVGLWCCGQKQRELCQRQHTFGEAQHRKGLHGGHRQWQRARIGYSDILGGKDDHAAQDKVRVFAGLTQPRQVVHRCIRVRATQRLDKRRDHIVVLVAVFVVAQDFVLQCLLQRRGIQVALTARIGLAQMSGGFQRRKQPPRIARRASNQLLANGRRELQL